MGSPAVVLADGDSASGMAMMLADLLESNVRDFPSRRRVATMVRGEVVFTAADRDVSVTLAFGPGSIEIRNGALPGAPVIAAPWLAMTKVCSGTLSPWVAWREGQLKVDNLRRAPLAAAASSWALSVPASFYEQADGAGAGAAGEPMRRRTLRDARIPIVIGVGLGVVAVVVVVAGRKRRSNRIG
jgi:hypothetical protein